jgi:hypothetical protein
VQPNPPRVGTQILEGDNRSSIRWWLVSLEWPTDQSIDSRHLCWRQLGQRGGKQLRLIGMYRRSHEPIDPTWTWRRQVQHPTPVAQRIW